MHLYIKQKKIKKLIISSNNRNKINEIKYLFPVNFKILTLKDIGLNINFQEIGKSFEENALIKAKKVFKITNIPCISDDSGLEVTALSGNPGIYSSRYSITGNSKDNINKLLFHLKNKYIRNARLISVICLKLENYHYFFKGILLGDIAQQESKYRLGFGYDSIFIPKNYGKVTLSQLSMKEKNNISHRSKAIKQCLNFLENYK